VGAAEALALVGGGEDGLRGLRIEGLEAEDVALGVAGDGEAAAGVEGHAVGARLAATIGLAALVAAGLEKDACASFGSPAANAVGGDVCEEEAAVRPHGAFDPGEAGGDALERGARGDDAVDGGIEAIDFEGRGVEDAGGGCLRWASTCGGAVGDGKKKAGQDERESSELAKRLDLWHVFFLRRDERFRRVRAARGFRRPRGSGAIIFRWRAHWCQEAARALHEQKGGRTGMQFSRAIA